jgi:hypothetical protein
MKRWLRKAVPIGTEAKAPVEEPKAEEVGEQQQPAPPRAMRSRLRKPSDDKAQ